LLQLYQTTIQSELYEYEYGYRSGISNTMKEHLKKYTAPSRSKTYYENHKEELLEKMKKYKPSPEQIKERNKKAYLKRKEKKEAETDI
jgi:hypothetical protein